MLGQVVGSYHITEILGRGGMGVVYLGTHQQIDRRAAIKVLLPELSHDDKMLHRFFNEARAANAIKHPSIVDIHDFGRHTDGSAYIVMEYLEGETLGARLRRMRALPAVQALVVTRQVAGALGAAHDAGIIHRDLKPDNIFHIRDPEVPGGERIKLLDFGIAKLLETSHPGAGSHTRTNALMGTPTYMSPEQCRGAGLVDHRSDLYALGCILYGMLCGRPPFDPHLGAGEIIAAHLQAPVEPPSTYVHTLSRDIQALVLRLLAKQPGQRHGHARDLVADCDRILASPEFAGQTPVHSSGAHLMAPGTAASTPPGSSVPPASTPSGPGHSQPHGRAPAAPSVASGRASGAGNSSRLGIILATAAVTIVVGGIAAILSFSGGTPSSGDAGLEAHLAGALDGGGPGGALVVGKSTEPVDPGLDPLGAYHDAGTIAMTSLLDAAVAPREPVESDECGQALEHIARLMSGEIASDAAAYIGYRRYLDTPEQAERMREVCSTSFDTTAMACFQAATSSSDVARCGNALVGRQCVRGDQISCVSLAAIRYEKQDYGIAGDLAERACSRSVGSGCKLLGTLHYYGRGLDLDYTRAIELFRQAYALGDIDAGSAVAGMLRHGVGVPRDQGGARELYTELCDDDPTHGACAVLGEMKERGLGGRTSRKQARVHYRETCDADVARGCVLLGDLIARADDEDDEADELYRQARALYALSEPVSSSSRFRLAELIRDGKGGAKSRSDAGEMLASACQDNEPLACLAAGELLAKRPRPQLMTTADAFERACQAGLKRGCRGKTCQDLLTRKSDSEDWLARVRKCREAGLLPGRERPPVRRSPASKGGERGDDLLLEIE